jgi:starch synthase
MHAMATVIHYQPEAYTTTGPRLMGRNAAGQSFLRAYLTHSTAPEFWVQVRRAEHARHFTQTVRSLGRAEPVRVVDSRSFGGQARAGTVYYPGPGIGAQALRRAAFGHGSWSLCGITHTLCSARAMDDIVELVTAPTQPWDALICTSTAGRTAVQQIIQAEADRLAARLGIQRLVLPRFPVIPLGVHTADFQFSQAQRDDARARLRATDKTHVVLFAGRLVFHAKAHPLALYQALEQAALRLPEGERLLLVEFGIFPNEQIRTAFRAAAQQACPHVQVLWLDGRSDENRLAAWAGADVFASLADNLQETFGLTPVEAMAAGLPVIVSDWDGYKDTVRDGVDGFRIPTLMPQAGLGGDLATRHALEIDTHDRYCGYTSSLVAVDVQATAEALVRLIRSAELRRQMGAAGRQRAREAYDWRVIIPRYEALWAELAEVRASKSAESQPLAWPWPARMDPFHGFAAYPTRSLTPDTVLALVDADARAAFARVRAWRQLAMIDFAKVMLPGGAEIQAVLQAAASGPRTARELVAAIPAGRQSFVLRSLAWLAKLGVLRVV